MKKLIVCLALAALALVPAMQAGEAKTCDAAKSACADKAKVACAGEAKAACCAKATTAKKHTETKGAALLVKR